MNGDGGRVVNPAAKPEPRRKQRRDTFFRVVLAHMKHPLALLRDLHCKARMRKMAELPEKKRPKSKKATAKWLNDGWPSAKKRAKLEERERCARAVAATHAQAARR